MPKTQSEAEMLAVRAVTEYLNACNMTDASQIGNYLMKLCSVAGGVMAQAEGSAMAANRLHGTAAFVEKNMPKTPATLAQIH